MVLPVIQNILDLQLRVPKYFFPIFSIKTYVVATQNNSLNEIVVLTPKTHV